MDTIDKLIKALEEAKEELNKASKDPALAPKEVKIKKLQAQIDAGTYKPNASKIAEKMLQKEELTCSENGQWNLNKIEPKIPSAPIKPKKLGPAPSNLHEWKSNEMRDHIIDHDSQAHKLPLHEYSDHELRDHIRDMHGE